MAIETEIAVAARDALSLFTQTSSQQENVDPAPVAQNANPGTPEEGVTLTLSAQGRLLAAFASIVDDAAAEAATAATASDAAQGAAATAAGEVADTAKTQDVQGAPLPVTRATLYAIEARLVAARRGADAIARADSELPPSDDPARIKQARQATDSLYGRAANPFSGLSRAELSAIVYDESGAYTVNERYAAANQRTELDQRFWAPVFQRAVSSGDWRPVIEAALVFYAGLSPLEQTAYPANYAQLMRQYLELYNLQPQAPLPPQQQTDLVRMMESLVLPSGPLALAGGVIRGLVLVRMPSMAELMAAAPHLADLIQANNLAHSVRDDAYLVLLQRVFGVARREDEPQVARRAGAAAAAQARDYLSFGDRRYLADAYAWAQANGLPLEEVDALAADLAAYRKACGGDGRDARRDASAGMPSPSTPQYYRMSAEDTATAQRLLVSRAARDSRLDHGFLAWLLDPGGGGWSETGMSGHAVSFSALEKLLAALAGVNMEERAGSDEELEPAYRYALYRIGLQDAPENHAAAPADGARTLTLAAQMAALARSDATDLAFMNNALMLLKMYRLSLKMSDVEQRTLAELVYASLRRRRARPRRGKLFVAWGVRSALMPSLPT
ncbi:hypothetical protein J8I26_11555 [Herbaspirillum sp. LeCh32-8]|uniref:hypothetical protein n=1 Tax=Herbaspirillum sp. LeCh32-8 TaxID=2821356 RepID=UPI001AE2B9D3|nr:hypothetical protein [Herbaspirillum sp. LeCh32-8]MBP0598746.1 hypothetical protein [Herbaspirillum sp. LeCh32-8]